MQGACRSEKKRAYRMSSVLAGKQSTLSGPSSGAVARDPSHSQLFEHSHSCYRHRSSWNPSVLNVRWHPQSRDQGLRETGSRPWLPRSFRHVFPSHERGERNSVSRVRVHRWVLQIRSQPRRAFLTTPFTVLISRSPAVGGPGPFPHASVYSGRADPRISTYGIWRTA
jgi:hypothetical protein